MKIVYSLLYMSKAELYAMAKGALRGIKGRSAVITHAINCRVSVVIYEDKSEIIQIARAANRNHDDIRALVQMHLLCERAPEQ